MSDDKKQTKQDRQRIAANEPYELSYFRKKHSLSVEDAKRIIKEAGNSRDKANALAAERKGK